VTQDPDSPALPPSIALAWGLRQHPRRGPKPGLTLDRIVAAGIKVALTEGLAGVSMGRVAGELGVATMSLYRYVSAKDDLLTLMVDAAIGTPPLAEPLDGDWRAGLTGWAVGVRAAYRRNLWALRVPISAPPVGPNNVAWLEAALRVLGGTALSESQKLSTVLLLSFFVRSEVTLAADIAAGSGGGPVDFGYGDMLATLTDPALFPALHRAMAAGAFDDGDDRDAYFNYGLGRILDGVGRLADERGRRPPAPAAGGGDGGRAERRAESRRSRQSSRRDD
jgi:AcrR family transcriptional regulator